LKVWIMTDMEGVAGVFSFDDASPSGRRYEKSRSLLTQEVNAAVEGALEAGATEVLVVDGHGPGGVDPEELHPDALLLAGRPLYPPWCLDRGFDAAFIVGQHALAGTEAAHLDHSYSHVSIQNIWLNGVRVGELGVIAAVAGSFGTATVLVTGDKAACAEAKRLIPGVETVAVKEALTYGSAIAVHPVKARRMIKEGAKRALARLDEIEPYTVKPPVELRIEYTTGYKAAAERLALKPGVEMVDPRTVVIRGNSLLEVFGMRL